MTLRDGVDATRILLGLVLAMALGVGAYIGYTRFTTDYSVTTDVDGAARARVVTATLFGRNDLRVAELTGTVQGTARASRLWGWLTSTQVVKAPYTVSYLLPLGKLRLQDFSYDRDRGVLFITAPDPVAQAPNVNLAGTTLNDVDGVFVSRGAMVEMSTKVAASARAAAVEKANSPEYRERARAYARTDLEQLFGGVLRATGLEARIEVRFPGDPMPPGGERWDLSRSLKEVLGDTR